jgi:addiction module RelB/DinJ family antitoxin
MTTALVQVDEELKREADAVLAGFGLTVGGLMQTLLTRIAKEKALPFAMEEPVIGAEELARRRDAVEFACVNVELEGLAIGAEHQALLNSYARGETSLEDLGKQVDKIIYG